MDPDAADRAIKQLGGQDAYAILGVTEAADAREIKAAYRRLALVHHPDARPGGGEGEEMKRINAAWNILSNHRPEYDRRRAEERRQRERQQKQTVPPPRTPPAPEPGGEPSDLWDEYADEPIQWDDPWERADRSERDNGWTEPEYVDFPEFPAPEYVPPPRRVKDPYSWPDPGYAYPPAGYPRPGYQVRRRRHWLRRLVGAVVVLWLVSLAVQHLPDPYGLKGSGTDQSATVVGPPGVTTIHPMSGPSGEVDGQGSFSVYPPTSNTVSVTGTVTVRCAVYGPLGKIGSLGSSDLWDYTTVGWFNDRLLRRAPGAAQLPACRGDIAAPTAAASAPSRSTGPFPVYAQGGAVVRSGPSQESSSVTSVTSGTLLSVQCHLAGARVRGPLNLQGHRLPSSSVWLRVQTPNSSYVAAALVHSPRSDLGPLC